MSAKSDWEAKIALWLDGKLSDDRLSAQDIAKLEKRVMKAIATKLLEDDRVTTFQDHKTLQ